MNQWQPRKRAEQQYAAELFKLLSSFFTKDKEGSDFAVRLLNAAEFIARYAQQAATRMVTGLYFDGARNWRAAARHSMKGELVYAALQREMQGPVGDRFRELIMQNAELIRTLPQNVARLAVARVAREAQAGGRAESSVREAISRYARRHSALIARTEVSKASTALTQARAENLDLPWYVWEGSMDQRVRPSHRKMQGVLVRWEDPPSPERLIGEKSTLGSYHAGNAPNCRCYTTPVLNLNTLRWPMRVHYNGRVQSMTLSTFRKINNLPLRRAA